MAIKVKMDLNNIRKTIGEELNNVQDEFLDQPLDESLTGNYIGKIVDNKDPDKLGRCRIRIYGVFDDKIPDEHLPWAQPDFGFVGSKKGSFIVPPKDAIVRVYFENGDIYLPVYMTKVIDKNNLPTKKDEDYPDTMCFFETDEGDSFIINRKTCKVTFEHNSGNIVTMEKNGNLNIEVKKNLDVSVSDDITMESKNTEIKATSEINIEGITTNINGTSITIKGSNIEIKGPGFLTVNGTVIPGIGPFCALPNCVITGAPHTGSKVAIL